MRGHENTSCEEENIYMYLMLKDEIKAVLQKFFASQGFGCLLSGLEQSWLGYFEMKLTV